MKHLLIVSMCVLAASFGFAGGQVEEEVEPEVVGNEAPELAALVEAGELPPLEERLPAEPMVVEAVDSIGEYGGTWHRAFRGIADFHAFGRLVYEPMLRWPRDPADPVQPGLAKEWEWSEDNTVLTLYLREGLKWSDGHPFTVDDIIFWWEDIENDPEITADPASEWVVDGEPMELERISDTEIELRFAGPNGLAETVGLAFHGNQWPLGFERFGFFAPRHYLEDYHPRYNDDVDYGDFEDAASDYNTERPSMTAWRITEWREGADHMIATRNPYYWKVDEEGKQLPYIDEVYFYLVDDVDAVNTLMLAGDLDMQHRGADFANIGIFMEQGERYGYEVYMWENAAASFLSFKPNQSYADEKYRELMQERDFRIALSHAIDRDLINEVGFLGHAVPRTISVVEDSRYFIPELENIYGEYDPDRANELLDNLGLERGADGFRTFPDGSRLQLTIETQYDGGAQADGIEIVAENWEDVGLETRVDVMTRDVYWPRATGNEVMIATWGTDRGLVPMIDPIYQFPFDDRSWMAPAWGVWYQSRGARGEEPPDRMKELMELYDEYSRTIDPDRQQEIGQEIVRRTTEEMNIVPTVGQMPALAIVGNHFHNVQREHTADWLIMTPGTMNPEHFWMEQ